jgi:hypothetical protein
MAYRWPAARLDRLKRTVDTKISSIIEDTTAQLGGDINLSTFALTRDFVAGETLAVRDLCYVNGTGRMVKTDASSASTSKGLIMVCSEALSLGETGTFYEEGSIEAYGFTAGDVLYVSTTAGEWHQHAPNGSGETVRVVGYGIANNRMLFYPDETWIELL